ncbi:MAG TPA: glycoside hydrolase [Pseudonocardiaceae bacterium]|nr:glycoside hydrolase [Pseudonocardiaceae bacterium]
MSTSAKRRRTRAVLGACAGLATATVLAAVLPATPAFAAGTVTINGATTYQSIDGFGASEAFGQADAVMHAPAAQQQRALDLLYSSTDGAGLDILRNEISADANSSIEPSSPGSPSAQPSYRSLAQINSDNGQLWFAQQIKSRYGVSNVFADAWSAPGFMKTNKSAINGGTLCGVPNASCASGDWRQAYANYLTQYAKDYAAAGVPLSYVGPENEANYAPGYDSMLLNPAQTANFLDYLGPTVARSGLSTQVECCATEGWNLAQQHAAAIEKDSTANSYTKVFTSHGYTQAPNSRLNGWTKPAWETEWYGVSSGTFDTAWDDGSRNSGFAWAQNIYNGLVNANLSAYMFWWGTVNGGGNTSLVALSNGTASASGRLWAFANYSRFIRPGAVRIGAGSPSSTVEVSAYRNTNGSVSVVVLNTGSGSASETFSLSGTGTANGATVTPYLTDSSNHVAAQHTTTVGNGSFTATIPGRSLVTYVIAAH